MYKIINGNQTSFEESLNELGVGEIVSFCCSNDASKYVALVKIDEAYLEKKAKAVEAALKAEEAAKAKADKEAKEAEKEALKKKLAEMENAEE